MFKKISFLLLIVTIFIFNSAFVVIGHRGDPIKAPEETFQSFDTAFNEGADYAELDVHLSNDNVLIVSHDKNLQRITKKPLIVSDNDYNTLSTLTVANGEHIHSLNEVFEHYKNNPKAKFLIETKKTKHGNPKDMEKILYQVINQYHMENRVAFHSFSEESLEKLANYFPNSQRIFISGSLQRLNFDVFKYSTGVNISSDLITPTLVNQLHSLNQKVYVWDEMNENKNQWNWLVNMPIDGVVTNFSATGAKYRDLKNKAEFKNTNENFVYINKNEIPIYENPYIKSNITGKSKYLDSYNVQDIVTFNNKSYFQLSSNEFVSSEDFIPESQLEELLAYMNSTFIVKNPKQPHIIYKQPNSQSSSGTALLINKKYKILSIKKDGHSYWLKTTLGWVLANNTLINFQDNQGKHLYFSLPQNKRLININLNTSPISGSTAKSFSKIFNYSDLFEK
ncbi:glycerophosphodiester phosphodiesterase [Companilactobacillus sp. DQM5]|uniref:glycerophosphodiester phosphodiesterase n=1 Tax=Companilactobacillus sp. DQM5 TaxID=3463359 RepID=UPI0040587EC2